MARADDRRRSNRGHHPRGRWPEAVRLVTGGTDLSRRGAQMESDTEERRDKPPIEVSCLVTGWKMEIMSLICVLDLEEHNKFEDQWL